jgi:hypothetical protein
MDLGDMRDLVRADLHDENEAAYRWTDAELDRHIARAVKEFSTFVPLEQKVVKATDAGSRDIDISDVAGRTAVIAVEYPAGDFPPAYRRWSLWADTLTLVMDELPDGSDACIYYGKLHTLSATASTIPEAHEDLVATGAAGHAAIAWAMGAVNQVNTGGTSTPAQFLEWGRERLAWFRREIRRLGAGGRVRVRSLYPPFDAPVSGTTDFGPG